MNKTEKLVLDAIKFNPDCADDDAKLLATVWEKSWDHEASLYYNLKRVPHSESLTRARRKLHEKGLIKYSTSALKRRTKRFSEYRDENSTANIHAIKKNIEKPQIIGDTAYFPVDGSYKHIPNAEVISQEPMKVQTSMLGDKS